MVLFIWKINKWYHTDEFNPKYFAKNRGDLEKMIEYCLANGWRPVLITIPVAAALDDVLLDDYMQKYLKDNFELVNTHGAPYIDYLSDSRITKNTSLFGNADHLNEKGAKIFSYLLLQDLIKRFYLSNAVDGYQYPLE